MPTATAVVVTDHAERYAKQLIAHVGRKNGFEALDGVPTGGRIVFTDGIGTIRPEPGRLVLLADAADEAGLAHVTDVLGRHLERFGARRELHVVWNPD